MVAEWFYMRKGDIVGPLSAVQLRQHALAKRIAPEDYVRRGTDGDWVAASKVKGLFDPPTDVQPEPEPTPDKKAEGTTSNPKLIDCPDCGKSVSRRAEKCPHCGGPLSKDQPLSRVAAAPARDQRSEPVGEPHKSASSGPTKSGSNFEKNLLRFLIAVVLFLIIGIVSLVVLGLVRNLQDGGHTAPAVTSPSRGRESPGGSKPTSDPDAAVKDSWAKFVDRAKSNIGKAISDSKGKVADDVEIVWISDDVKRSASVKHPYEGIARVKSVHVFGNTRGSFEHTLRFGYEDGRWVFLGGQEVNDSRSFELKSLRFIYLRTMFDQ